MSWIPLEIAGQPLTFFPRLEASPAESVLDYVPSEKELKSWESWHQEQPFKRWVILGFGGSINGARVWLESQNSAENYSLLDTCDPRAWQRAQALDSPETGWILISKSGRTLEVQAAMEHFSAENSDWSSRVTVITESVQTPLGTWAQSKKRPVILVPKAIGGRFSIFTAAALVPYLAVGGDPRKILADREKYLASRPKKGTPAQYWASQQIRWSEQGIFNALLWQYGTNLEPIGTWWQQLWAESLNKFSAENPIPRGVIPLIARGPADQHSLLQMVAQPFPPLGAWLMLEKPKNSSLLELQWRAIAESLAKVRSISAWYSDGSPEDRVGYLYEWMVATLLVAREWGINPYDQPAVEAGKILTATYYQKTFPSSAI